MPDNPSFWDDFVRRVFAGFVEGNPDGLDKTVSLLALAFRRGLMDPATLDDRSLILCLLACSPGDPLYQAADKELIRRGVSPEEKGHALTGLCPRRMSDILWLGIERHALAGDLVFQAVAQEHAPNLSKFYSRTFMMARGAAEATAWIHLSQVFTSVKLGTLIEWKGDFAAILYRRVVRAISWDKIPTAWPSHPPGWANGISEAERRFIDCSHKVQLERRRVLYLSFWAGLNTEQIGLAVTSKKKRTTPGEAALELVQGWQEVLGQM